MMFDAQASFEWYCVSFILSAIDIRDCEMQMGCVCVRTAQHPNVRINYKIDHVDCVTSQSSWNQIVKGSE